MAVLTSLAILLAVYAAFVLALVLAGRRTDARALAGFVPDCLVLLKRLLRDPRVPRARKTVLALLVAYLVLPIDLVPDFIPVAGQLDDLLVASLALRLVLRARPELLREHWPAPQRSLELILRIVR